MTTTIKDEIDKELRTAERVKPPELERVGLGYVARFPQLHAIMAVRRLRESGGQLHGELTVELEVRGREHLAQGQFNLSSLQTRNLWASSLVKQYPAGWKEALELFCLGVLREHRGHLKFTVVGNRPRREEAPMLVSPTVRERLPTVVYAPGGTGKTTFLAAHAVVAQTGHEVIPGFQARLRGPVLILDYETTADDWNDLVAAICAGAGIEPIELRYLAMARPLAEVVEEVAEIVTEEAVALIVLDSVEAACGSNGDRNYNDRANGLFDALRLLNTGSILADHVAAADLERDSATPKPYGGVFKMNRARSVFELRAEKEPTPERVELALIDGKRNLRAKLDPIGLAMCFDDFDAHGQARAIRFERTGIEAEDLAVAALTRPQRIARLLRTTPLKPVEIAERLDLRDNLVRSILSKGKGRRFNPLPDGRWGLAAHV